MIHDEEAATILISMSLQISLNIISFDIDGLIHKDTFQLSTGK